MYRIRKEFHFSASHIIDGLPEGHPCGRLHGHNYKVEVFLEAKHLDEVGFVRDFGDLDIIKKWIDDTIDHRHLNDVFNIAHDRTTAEGIARIIFRGFSRQIPELVAVRVWETPKAYGEYSN